jgi:hypothetical protein
MLTTTLAGTHMKEMLPRLIVRSFLGVAVLGLLLFLPAGTLAWPQGWIFLILFGGCGLALGLWLLRADPELLARRMKSPFSAEQKLSDRLIVGAIFLFMCGWFVLIALDGRRFGWSDAPSWAQAVGAALIVAAFWGWVGVLGANRFATDGRNDMPPGPLP